MDDAEQSCVLIEVAQYAINVAAGLDQVKAEWDSSNNKAYEDAPSVMPAELVKLHLYQFFKIALVMRAWKERLGERITSGALRRRGSRCEYQLVS